MSSVVTIVYNKFKTVEIKTTPSKTLKMLVQEMCQRVPELGDADRYGLKWKNTDLDLSLSMRLSRLPHGAKIELVPNKHLGAKVKVVLQLPTGDRIQKDVVNTATLKEIVCSLVELGAEDEPVLLILNQQLSGEELLSKTKLISVGVTTGSILVKLTFKNGNHAAQPKLSDAIKSEKPALPKDVNNVSERPDKHGNENTIIMPKEKGAHKEVQNATYGCSLENVDTREVDDVISRRKAKFIEFSESGLKDAIRESTLPDSFYELTGDEAKMMLRQRNVDDNKAVGFKTQKHRDIEAREALEKKKKLYKTSLIQFKFVDGSRIQATFGSDEKLMELYSFITAVTKQLEYTIHITHPYTNLQDMRQKTFFEANFVPNALVHVVFPTSLNLSEIIDPALRKKGMAGGDTSKTGSNISSGYSKDTFDDHAKNSSTGSAKTSKVPSSLATLSSDTPKKDGKSAPKWLSSVSKFLKNP